MLVNLIAYPNLIYEGIISKRFKYQVRDNGVFCADHHYKIFVYDSKLAQMNDTLTTVRFTDSGVTEHINLIKQYAKSLKKAIK